MTSAGKRLRVLVVEDSPTDALLLREMLARPGGDGFSSAVAPTVGEGFSRLDQQEFDVILLDLNLPDSWGLGTFQKFNARHPDVATIVVTGQQDDELGIQAIRQGAQDYLIKGQITHQVFVRALRYAVERKQMEAQLRQSEQHVRQRTERLRELTRQLMQAEEKERRRLARMLHDDLQQLLVAARFAINTAESSDGQEPKMCWRDADDLLEQSIEACRSLAFELSPLIHKLDFASALRRLVQRNEKMYGLEVLLDCEAWTLPGIAEDVRVTVFQCVRELLLNVVKHAAVRQVTVTLSSPSDQWLQVAVHDQGNGFDVPAALAATGGTGGLGLFSMGERLALIGGSMSIESKPGSTRVVLDVPLSDRAGQQHRGEPRAAADDGVEET